MATQSEGVWKRTPIKMEDGHTVHPRFVTESIIKSHFLIKSGNPMEEAPSLVKTIEMDEKGRIVLPKEIREWLKKREVVIVSDNFGVRIYPKLTLKEMHGISKVKVGTDNLREEKDDPNRIF